MSYMFLVCSSLVTNRNEVTVIKRWMLAAGAVLVAAAIWQAPASAQQSMPPAGPAEPPITFEAYRNFRLDDIARREARLIQRLAEPNLAAADEAALLRQKAYYDRLTALPAAERDRLFRARFNRIDTDHDGTIDAAERAAWRTRQRDYYRQVALARARENAPRP